MFIGVFKRVFWPKFLKNRVSFYLQTTIPVRGETALGKNVALCCGRKKSFFPNINSFAFLRSLIILFLFLCHSCIFRMCSTRISPHFSSKLQRSISISWSKSRHLSSSAGLKIHRLRWSILLRWSQQSHSQHLILLYTIFPRCFCAVHLDNGRESGISWFPRFGDSHFWIIVGMWEEQDIS